MLNKFQNLKTFLKNYLQLASLGWQVESQYNSMNVSCQFEIAEKCLEFGNNLYAYRASLICKVLLSKFSPTQNHIAKPENH